MSVGNKFSELELFNVQIDVWIDEEEYQRVYNYIVLQKKCKSKVNKLVENGTSEEFNKLLSEIPPIESIKISETNEIKKGVIV